MKTQLEELFERTIARYRASEAARKTANEAAFRLLEKLSAENPDAVENRKEPK